MIQISEKNRCCGCSACLQRCPKSCITLHEDQEGFLYPVVDESKCVDCKLCEKVCPVLNQGERKNPLSVYASMNTNESIRKQSSSGGVFSLLAGRTIKEGGIVFGARFDEKWEVTLDWTDSLDGIAAFRGSKYLQSKVGESYKQAESFLKQGRQVLFTGSPCQVAGLKHYLRKEYNNLFTVDFLCHGVPSPKVWRLYLKEWCEKESIRLESLSHIAFRSKELGWKNFSLKLETTDGKVKTESFRENIFMRAFLRDMILRPSCYVCPSKSGKSASDITIADYWGIQNVCPEIDDDKGTSLVMVNTKKGKDVYDSLDVHSVETGIREEAKRVNGGFLETIPQHPNRSLFFKELDRAESVIDLIDECTNPSLMERIKQRFNNILR